MSNTEESALGEREDDHLPSLSTDLIEMLDKEYPQRCLLPGELLESAHRYAGARELIDALVAWQNEAT